MKRSKAIGTQEVVAVAIGSALFAVLMNYGSIPVFTNTKLGFAYLIPVLIGAYYGIIPAALVGFFGNIFADFMSGGGYWFDWSIGNMIASAAVGCLPLLGVKIKEGIFTTKQAITYAVIVVLGLGVSFGLVTPLLTKVFFGGELEITFAQAYMAVISNGFIVLVVGIPLLFVLANRYKKQNNLVEEK